MKKSFSIILALAVFITTSAQEKNQYTKGHVIGIHFTLHDFETAMQLKNSSLSDVLNNNEWSKVSEMDPGFALSYTKGISNNLDVMARLGMASLKYPRPGVASTVNVQEKTLVEADVNFHLKLLSDKYWVSPYISAGAGASQWNGYYAAYFPAGLGIQINIFDEVFGNIQAQYRLPLTSNANNNLFYSFGIGANIGKKKEVIAPLPPVPVVVDTDNDGIPDATDKCPTVPGIAKYDGCPIPDTDKDGINDEQDKCPTVAGLERYQGCPIPDTDSDGINDEEDKCPAVAGLARYQGCPIPDTDGDGINDEEDKCISVAGLADNKGCPEMVFYYKRAEAALDAKEKADLDRLVVWMGNHPELSVSINGHTSTLGATDYNQKLSEKRAQNTVKFLVSKGIDAKRLKAVGYGEQFPIGDNSKEEGRALSRRVVMRIAD